MVLPSSTADPADGPDRPAWLSKVTRVLGLADSGVLVLVANAASAQLRALVLALLEREPGLRVCMDAGSIVDVPEGACVLVRVVESDCTWLNRVRPIFAERRWRVVLWADGQATLALPRQAPDFFDWISHVVQCPPAVPGFAIRGLSQAPAYPGVAWRSGDLDAALARVSGDESWQEVSAREPYEELVERARGAGWLVCRDVEGARDVARVRWALAESGRRGRYILDRPRCATPGFWPVDGVCESWAQASRDIAGADGHEAALLAALLAMEPGTSELARALIEAGAEPAELIAMLVEARELDPGAALAERAFARGLVNSGEVARLRASPCVLRGLRDAPEVAAARAQVVARVQDVVMAWSEGRGRDWELDDDELALWAGQGQGPALREWPPPVPNSVYWLEATLSPDMKELPQHAFSWVVKLGYLDVADHWASVFETSPIDLVNLREQQGDYLEAERLLRRILAFMEKHMGTEHLLYPGYQVYLADLLAQQGRYKEATSLFHEVLTWIENKGDGKAMVYMSPFIRVLLDQGRGDQAEELVRRALRIEENRSELPEYTSFLSLLAEVLEHQGRHGEAEELLRRAVGMQERGMGGEHPDYANSLSLLAGVLEHQGRHGEAEALLRRAVGVQRMKVGSEHRDYADSLSLLAELLERQGRYGEAEELLRRAIGIQEKELGNEHPDYADSLSLLAELLARQGRYGEAESLLRRTLAIQENVLGTEHPVMCRPLRLLAGLELATGRPEQAKAFIDRAHDIALQSPGPQHPEMQHIEPLWRKLHHATETDS